MEIKEILQIATVQVNLVWEDISANIKHISKQIESIPKGVDIIVLPEMFSTGFSMQPNLFAETMDGLAVKALKNWAQTSSAAICGSFMYSENGKYFNRFIWFEPNGNCIWYDKAHLFRMGEEQLHYTAGNQRVVIDYKGWKIAPFVCYDLRFPVWIRKTQNFNYDLLIFVANWPDKRVKHWDQLACARAIENQSYLVAVNRVGIDGNGIDHSGHSKVIDPLGELLYIGEQGEECKVISIDYVHLAQYRNSFPVGLDADKFELS
jgi:omega-amidase